MSLSRHSKPLQQLGSKAGQGGGEGGRARCCLHLILTLYLKQPERLVRRKAGAPSRMDLGLSNNPRLVVPAVPGPTLQTPVGCVEPLILPAFLFHSLSPRSLHWLVHFGCGLRGGCIGRAGPSHGAGQLLQQRGSDERGGRGGGFAWGAGSRWAAHHMDLMSQAAVQGLGFKGIGLRMLGGRVEGGCRKRQSSSCGTV